MILRVGAFAMLLAMSVQAGQDRSKHPWAKWKPGTWAKIRADGKTALYTLKSVSDKGYTLTIQAENQGKLEAGVDREVPFSKDWIAGNPQAKEFHKQKISVAGTDYACTAYSLTLQATPLVEKRAWFDDATGRILKYYEITPENRPPGNVEVTATQLEEELEISGKKVTCIRLEGSYSGKMSGSAQIVTRLPIIYLHSMDVPGGWARRQEPQGMWVVDFETKP